METILAIDPAEKTGATLFNVEEGYKVSLWNNKPLTKTKKREGEPKYFRLKNLWDKIKLADLTYNIDVIVCEGAKGFVRGKWAVEASHKYRAVIQLYCAINKIKYIEIQPNDLKFFALGKRSGEKSEMIAAANKLGYEGNEDNEADSFLICKWYQENN